MGTKDTRTDPVRDQLFYLDSAIRGKICCHFKDHIGRAFDTLRPDKPIWDSDTSDDLVGKSEFYRAMQGKLVLGSKIERIELCWVLLDKGSGKIPQIPSEPGELRQWIQIEFGFLRTLHEELFPDWSYATLRNVVAGIGTKNRFADLLARLARYRDKETERREAAG